MDYEFFNYYNNKQPNYIHTQVREEHHSQNPVVTWQESYEYSNGMGGVLLTKVQTKDGEALQYQNGVLATVDTSNLPTKRWIGNGRTIMNNKGMPIKQFEPYFSVTHEFEAAAELVEIGVSPVLFYDAAGRNYRTELPDGTFTKVEFDAWQSTSYDTNDTVLDSDWYQSALINNPLAAQEAAKQANTPTKVHLDSLGRTVYAENIAPNAVDNTAMYTQTDLAGRYSFIYDEIATAQLLAQPNNYTPARGFTSYSKTNLLGQAVYTKTAVKGDSYVLTDALGRMLRAWDNPDNTAQSLTLETDYDNLHRPLKTYVKKGSNQRICFAQTTYGESLVNATALNLRGQAYESYDQSGKMTTVALDFKGNPLEVTRELTKVYDQTIDWNQNPVLEQDIFRISSSYDALNRPTLTTLPDGTQLKPTYNSGGYLEQLEAQIMGQGGFMTFLDGQDYDAKGQKQWVKFGNNTITEYFYDAKTFRLERLLTTHPNHQPDQTKLNYNINKLQDLYYNYDTIGNLLQVEDKAQSTFYYNNQAISPLKRYEYDHLSRLKRATGREHAGAAAPTHQDLVHLQNLPHQNIQNAVRQYTQTYKYDAVGNILQMQHQTGQGTGSWTRDYTYSQDAKNQLLQTTLSSTGTTANYNHYDIHGNMTRMPHLQALTWNFGDELVRVEHTGMTAYYNYDGGGQRVRKVVQKGTKREERLYLGGVERYRVYDGNNTIEEESWTVQIEGIAQVDTKTITNSQAVNTAPLIRYQYNDHFVSDPKLALWGSATLETDDQANIISYEEYHPFGTTAYSAYINSSYSIKRYRFSNKERDDETGLYYFGVRYYAAWLGRWTSSDPGGFIDGLNLYRYVRNNPVNLVDPDGMSSDPPPDMERQFQGMIEAYPGHTITANHGDIDGVEYASIRVENESGTVMNLNYDYGTGRWLADRSLDDSKGTGINSLGSITIPAPPIRRAAIAPIEITTITAGPIPQELDMGRAEGVPNAPSGGGIGTTILDGVQLTLGIIGMVPGLGEIADGIDLIISAMRGDWVGVGISLAAMIPFLGWAAGAGKIGKRLDDVYGAVKGWVDEGLERAGELMDRGWEVLDGLFGQGKWIPAGAGGNVITAPPLGRMDDAPIMRMDKAPDDLPGLTKGKVHSGEGFRLPKPSELKNYSIEDLIIFKATLEKSVKKRILETKKAYKKGTYTPLQHKQHGERQALEQDLIHAIDKYLETKIGK